ncbi:MAG TPA: helix-turn-helix domain-containing protein [Actinomycetota bacterium]|nr:helix-turn-helix domain-containing protein [Actinomycetota bacterium]
MREPLRSALDRVGDRWSLLIVEALLRSSEPRRWTDLAEELSDIAPNVLSERLRRLERDGVVTARPYSDRPVRLAYDLTAAGRELAGALRLLAQWGAERWDRADRAEPLRHVVCGTPLEARWYCATCGRAVEEDEGQDLRYV